MKSEIEFFRLYDEALSINPYLYIEIAYTRPTDWMIHVWRKNGGYEKSIFSVQELTRKKACKKAAKKLMKYIEKMS